MINFNELKIDSCARHIILDVGIPKAEATFISLMLYNEDSYNDMRKRIDLSDMLKRIDNEEKLIINASKHLNKDFITGLWFIELETDVIDEKTEKNIKKVEIVANIEPFRECVLNKLLDLDINDCDFINKLNCSDCNDNVLYINTLLTSFIDLLKTQCYKDAIKILKTLNELCASCLTCSEYLPSSHYIDGLTYGIRGNQLTLIKDNECMYSDEDLRAYFISKLNY